MVREQAAAVERWFFYQDAAKHWKWARLDVFGTVLEYSAGAFASRDACLADARRSGYTDRALHTASRLALAGDHRPPPQVAQTF